MKTPTLILISAILMAGCAENPGPRPGSSAGFPEIASSFAGAGSEIIRVQVTDEKPATGIELLSPAGQVYAANRIDRTQVERRSGAGQPGVGVGVGVFGGSSSGVSTGVGIGIPLSVGGEAARPALVQSAAELAIPDMAAYRTGWREWRIRVTFAQPSREIILPAPEPPKG